MRYIDELCDRRKNLVPIKYDIVRAFELLRDTYKDGNKVLICGNGGSSADSAHITGELMKGFKKKREISEELEKNLKVTIEDFMERAELPNSNAKLLEMKEMLEVGLPTIDITSFSALNSAFSNDKNFLYAYANGVLGLGKKGDVLIAISTSGNSKNVINASLVAKSLGMKVIALSGFEGGKLKNIADINIIVPINETFLIQEEHIAIYHAICLDLEEEFF